MNEQATPQVRHLLGQCSAGIRSACDEAFSLLLPLFKKMSARVCREYGRPEDCDDITQEICLKLSANINTRLPDLPSDDHNLHSYLAIFAANVARDFQRAKGAQKRSASATVTLDDSTRNISWALGSTPPLEREVLLRQIEDNVQGTPRQKTIFRLFYKQGLSAREIAQIPHLGLTTKGVESLLFRICQELRAAIQFPKYEEKPARGPSL